VTCFARAALRAGVVAGELYQHQKALGIAPLKSENQPTGPLPPTFRDEFWLGGNGAQNWRDLQNALPPEERTKTAIFANSYGQAGAIDFFGRKYGLPKSIAITKGMDVGPARLHRGNRHRSSAANGTGDRKHFASVEAAGRDRSSLLAARRSNLIFSFATVLTRRCKRSGQRRRVD